MVCGCLHGDRSHPYSLKRRRLADYVGDGPTQSRGALVTGAKCGFFRGRCFTGGPDTFGRLRRLSLGLFLGHGPILHDDELLLHVIYRLFESRTGSLRAK